MKIKKNIYFILLTLFITALTSIEFREGQAKGDDVVAIVHASNSGITRSKLKHIFTGKISTWSDGSRIKLLLNSNGKLLKDFCAKYLSMTPSRLKKIWLKKSSRDGVLRPHNIKSSVIVIYISSSPEYVGFVKRSELNATTAPSVKIIE